MQSWIRSNAKFLVWKPEHDTRFAASLIPTSFFVPLLLVEFNLTAWIERASGQLFLRRAINNGNTYLYHTSVRFDALPTAAKPVWRVSLDLSVRDRLALLDRLVSFGIDQPLTAIETTSVRALRPVDDALIPDAVCRLSEFAATLVRYAEQTSKNDYQVLLDARQPGEPILRFERRLYTRFRGDAEIYVGTTMTPFRCRVLGSKIPHLVKAIELAVNKHDPACRPVSFI